MPADRRWDLGTERVRLKEKIDRQWRPLGSDAPEARLISMLINEDDEFFYFFLTADWELLIKAEAPGCVSVVTKHWGGDSDLVEPYVMSRAERTWFQACARVAITRRRRGQ